MHFVSSKTPYKVPRGSKSWMRVGPTPLVLKGLKICVLLSAFRLLLPSHCHHKWVCQSLINLLPFKTWWVGQNQASFYTCVISGFPLFSLDKIPWLFQYFFHFSLTFIKYFLWLLFNNYFFIITSLHALKYSFYNIQKWEDLLSLVQKNSWNSNNSTLNILWAYPWHKVAKTLPKKRDFCNIFSGKNSVIFQFLID